MNFSNRIKIDLIGENERYLKIFTEQHENVYFLSIKKKNSLYAI